MNILDSMSFDIRTIVDKANTNCGKSISQMRQIVDENELVVAVWQDAQERDGVGTQIVKGRPVLESIISSGESRSLSWTAVPCRSVEEAVALRQVVGDRDLH